MGTMLARHLQTTRIRTALHNESKTKNNELREFRGNEP